MVKDGYTAQQWTMPLFALLSREKRNAWKRKLKAAISDNMPIVREREWIDVKFKAVYETMINIHMRPFQKTLYLSSTVIFANKSNKPASKSILPGHKMKRKVSTCYTYEMNVWLYQLQIQGFLLAGQAQFTQSWISVFTTKSTSRIRPHLSNGYIKTITIQSLSF